ncbi:MAG TPA: thioredoxin family protein [Steroidobacteraceae bacterium]
MFPRGTLALALCLTVAGCSKHSATQAPASGGVSAARSRSSPSAISSGSAIAAAPASIAWYGGSVESAFATARAQNKPVFLYWGAQWCPPCHELKATVFSRSDFIEKLKLFIPVYLDGDDPGAQKWGDQFGVTGYPTVLVLRADRSELARISGGMDLAQYSEVLDSVLGDVRPVGAILAALQAPGAQVLSRDDCHRLAYYGWDLTDEVNSRSSALAATLARAAARCPTGTEADRARLIVMAASVAADGEAAALVAGKAPGRWLVRLIGQVDGLLGDQALADSIADAIGDLDESFFQAVDKSQPERAAAWSRRYARVMEAAATEPRFSVADHLYFLNSELAATKALDAKHEIAPQLVARAHQRIDAALAGKLDEHARASVVNAALNILDLLGDDDRAYAITRAQMAQSKSPYYYMLDLASLDEKHGHPDSAVNWLAQAYAQSQGAATRFQWGTEYLMGLIRMKPTDDARIRSAGLQVLGELVGPDRIYRRTRDRLQRLSQALEKWNVSGDHTATIAVLRRRMDGICSQIPKSDPANAACRGFLARGETTGA